jgi:hypothetical protein
MNYENQVKLDGPWVYWYTFFYAERKAQPYISPLLEGKQIIHGVEASEILFSRPKRRGYYHISRAARKNRHDFYNFFN